MGSLETLKRWATQDIKVIMTEGVVMPSVRYIIPSQRHCPMQSPELLRLHHYLVTFDTICAQLSYVCELSCTSISVLFQ